MHSLVRQCIYSNRPFDLLSDSVNGGLPFSLHESQLQDLRVMRICWTQRIPCIDAVMHFHHQSLLNIIAYSMQALTPYHTVVLVSSKRGSGQQDPAQYQTQSSIYTTIWIKPRVHNYTTPDHVKPICSMLHQKITKDRNRTASLFVA